MSSKGVFNAVVCAIGILIFFIHVIGLVIKKDKRRDEKILLSFFLFMIILFTTYLSFDFIREGLKSNVFIITFYTVFYIMNNIAVFIFLNYAKSYISIEPKMEKMLSILNYSAFFVFILLDIINIFTGIFFTAVNGEYVRSSMMILSQGYQFIMFITIFIVVITNDKLKQREKTAFCIYCFLPLAAIILQNIFKGYAIAYASIIIAIEVLYLFVNVQKSIVVAEEKERNRELQIKIMLSQIHPHFIYNSLSSISTLITIDAEKARAAIDNFTEYLRCNLSSLTETKLIPFEDELKHIEAYVACEKMRFGERVNVAYDIKKSDFNVPPLSIQPIVENGIKHGILKKLEGGNVMIKTYENADSNVVEIIDDGVGFNMADIELNENLSIGINNVRYRVENICGGSLEMKSEVGKGSHIKVTFPKEVKA